MAKIGRPSMLTPEVQERICELLRTGAPLETCADAVGVWPQALSEWQAQARDCVAAHKGDVLKAKEDADYGCYVEFAEAVARARAEAELMLLAKVSAAGKGGWAAGWILERVMRRRYHTRSESKVDATITGNAEGGADADAAAKARVEEFLKAAGKDAGRRDGALDAVALEALADHDGDGHVQEAPAAEEYRHGRPVITAKMAADMPCPFPHSEPDL